MHDAGISHRWKKMWWRGKEREEHTVSSLARSVDLEYPNCTLVPHTLFGDTRNKRIVLAERDPLYGGGELPGEQTFPRLDFPELHHVVRRTRDKILGFRCSQSLSTKLWKDHGEENAQSTSMVHIVPLCPSYVPNRSPLWVNQTFILWSFEQLKRISPSRLYLI